MKIRRQIDAVAQQAAAVTQQALATTATAVEALPARARQAAKQAQPLVEAQLATLEVATTLGAKRLKAASEATSFDALVKGQVALFPETKDAALAESRKYLVMFFDAKDRFDAAMKSKVLGWVSPKAPRQRKAAVQEKAAA